MTDPWATDDVSEVGPWELAGLPGRLVVAAYLTADQLAAQCRVIVDALLDAQARSEADFVRTRDRCPLTSIAADFERAAPGP
jgi:hypothetical protein